VKPGWIIMEASAQAMMLSPQNVEALENPAICGQGWCRFLLRFMG
jgi:hypothetical protein